MRLMKKNLSRFFMQDDYFPSFFNIRLINKTSFKELYGFYFYMIGKDANPTLAYSEPKLMVTVPCQMEAPALIT